MSTEIHEAGNGKAVNRVPTSQKQPFVLPLAVSCNVKHGLLQRKRMPFAIGKAVGKCLKHRAKAPF